MAFNFPSSPTSGDTHTAQNGTTYIFDGAVWNSTKTGAGLPAGGSAGQFLVKETDTNYDFTFKNSGAVEAVVPMKSSTSTVRLSVLPIRYLPVKML